MSTRDSEVERNGWTTFDVPNQFEDLQKQLATGSYYVQNVFDLADINTRLQNLSRIREPKELLDMFPLFYSIAINFDKVSITGRSQTVDILLRLTASEMSEAQRRIHIGLSADDRRFHLNIVKMLSCLLAEYIIRFDNDQANKSSDFDMPAPKKGKKAKEAENGGKPILTSDSLRDKCLKGLSDILRSHIKPLWDSSIIDEQFVKCVTKPCYHLIRRPDIAKNPIVKENLPLILTIMINKFEHAREASIQFIQAVKLYDSNSSLLITVLNSLLIDYQDTSLAIELLKEICETNFVAAQADNASAKTMATFIIDMARLDPHIIRTHIDQITDLLTAESHHIRVAALTALCSVIEKLLSSDELDDGQRKMRDDLLQILREHVSDVTAFVRQHCLQLWTSLVIQKKVPVRQYIRAFELGLDRLRDSACAVRKDAVTLVMHMVLNNPYFVVDSTRAQFEERQNDAETTLAELRQELEKLNKNVKEDKKIDEEKKSQSDDEDSGAEDESIDEDDKMNVDNNEKKETEDNNEPNEDQSLQETLARVKLEEQIMRVEEIVALYKDGLRFMDLIEQANQHVVNLFNSPTLADCKQAVDFFVNLRHYRLVLPNIEQSLRLMFSLIWSVDKSICEAITQAFVKIYFDVGPTIPSAHVPLHQARAIIRALKGATFSEELCFEEILKQLIKGKKIATESITEALWKFYKAPSDDHTDVIAGKILTFIVGDEVNTKLNDITDLIQAKEKNRRFVHISCLLLQLAATPKKIENGVRPKQFRLPKTHRLFEILGNIIVSTFHDVSDRQWTPMMESAFDVMFKLADGPIKHIENIIKKLAVKTGVKLGGLFKLPLSSQSQPLSVESMDFENAGTESNQNQLSQQHHHHHHHHTQTNANSALLLVRFLNCLGKAAVGIVYYVDCTVKDELLRRKEAKQSAAVNKKLQKKTRNSKKRTKRKTPDEDDENQSTSMNDTTNSASNRTLNSTTNRTVDDEQDDEMCQVFGGAEAEDPVDNEIGVYIQSLCEKNSLLMQYKNILEQILLHPNEYHEEALQLSATICLCKFMLLSVELCETHAKMLFDLLKNSTFESVRVAIMVLMNDFYLKYPLAFAAYSNDVYGCLRDRSDNVRLAALKTISNLILKEMVKPKGQISEIALCIIDKHPQIATLATSFFSELAKRQHGEALFNILPDIFSNLVGGGLDKERQLDEDDFKYIMEFLFKYVSKEKQTESLSEKLMQRFHLADNNPRLWRDLAYIMSKLTYNERSLKGLLDHYNYYADKLVEDGVYESFLTILNNAKKNLGTKPDLKVVLDELSIRIDQARSSNGILIAVQQAQQKTKQQPKNTRAGGAKKGKQTTSRSKAKAAQSDDDDDDDAKENDDDDDENDFKRPTRKEPKIQTISRSKRGAAVTARKKAAVVVSDEDDDD
ncbi:unnamed protein product [Rotaria sp. Silwood1]|nr:unnamed protein product [Rotaria sp. Silwood1]CAF0860980.1 unnamed protein product [Rotaria sp. Silwood1]